MADTPVRITEGAETSVLPETPEEARLERMGQELVQAHRELEMLQERLDEALGALQANASPGPGAEFFDTLSRLCHKINNPLTAVMGRAQILQLKLSGHGDESVIKAVDVIEDSAKRVADLVQELAHVVTRVRPDAGSR